MGASEPFFRSVNLRSFFGIRIQVEGTSLRLGLRIEFFVIFLTQAVFASAGFEKNTTMAKVDN